MLQMITVDGKDAKDGKRDIDIGAEEMNKTLRMDGQEGIRTKDLLLPQVMGATKNSYSLNMSADNIKMSEGEDNVENIDPYRPKM